MFEQSFIAKSKCAGCVLKSHAKDYPCQKEMDNPWLVRKGNRVLVVLEQPRQYQRGASYLQNVLRAIENHLGEKVDAIAGIECETKIHAIEDLSTKKNIVEESPIPNPFYKIYRTCNTVTSEIMQSYQVILTMGKALLAITKSDDIPSWEDFAEFNFNQTYFYTGVDTNPRRRVYPLPSDLDIYAKDNFEAKFFTPFQLQRVKEYLLAPEEPNLIELPRYEIIDDPVEFLRLLDKKLPKSEEVGVSSHFQR